MIGLGKPSSGPRTEGHRETAEGGPTLLAPPQRCFAGYLWGLAEPMTAPGEISCLVGNAEKEFTVGGARTVRGTGSRAAPMVGLIVNKVFFHLRSRRKFLPRPRLRRTAARTERPRRTGAVGADRGRRGAAPGSCGARRRRARGLAAGDAGPQGSERQAADADAGGGVAAGGLLVLRSRNNKRPLPEAAPPESPAKQPQARIFWGGKLKEAHGAQMELLAELLSALVAIWDIVFKSHDGLTCLDLKKDSGRSELGPRLKASGG